MKYLGIFISIAIVLTSCESDSSDTNAEENPTVNEKMPTLPQNSNITYQGNIKAILDAKCNQCHAVMPVRGAPFGLTDYAEVTLRDREERIAARANAGTMPPMNSGEPALTPEEVALINQWISDGALE